ncbi:hypothetical protein ACWCXH_34560 [Kitasatospora sp. NPDC001660]
MTANPMASRHRRIHLDSIVLLVAMLITGRLSCTRPHATDPAGRKAEQLSEAPGPADYPVPAQDRIVHTLGENGGAVCDDPSNAPGRARRKYGLPNGAGGPAYAAPDGAVQEACGRPTSFLGLGGSIPLSGVPATTCPEAEIIPTGVEEPRRLIHAPDESVDPGEIEHMAHVEASFPRQCRRGRAGAPGPRPFDGAPYT